MTPPEYPLFNYPEFPSETSLPQSQCEVSQLSRCCSGSQSLVNDDGSNYLKLQCLSCDGLASIDPHEYMTIAHSIALSCPECDMRMQPGFWKKPNGYYVFACDQCRRMLKLAELVPAVHRSESRPTWSSRKR